MSKKVDEMKLCDYVGHKTVEDAKKAFTDSVEKLSEPVNETDNLSLCHPPQENN